MRGDRLDSKPQDGWKGGEQRASGITGSPGEKRNSREGGTASCESVSGRGGRQVAGKTSYTGSRLREARDERERGATLRSAQLRSENSRRAQKIHKSPNPIHERGKPFSARGLDQKSA